MTWLLTSRITCLQAETFLIFHQILNHSDFEHHHREIILDFFSPLFSPPRYHLVTNDQMFPNIFFPSIACTSFLLVLFPVLFSAEQ